MNYNYIRSVQPDIITTCHCFASYTSFCPQKSSDSELISVGSVRDSAVGHVLSSVGCVHESLMIHDGAQLVMSTILS